MKRWPLGAFDKPCTAQYTAYMGGPSQVTVPATFRILRTQDAALKQLAANGVPTAALIRKLLSLYLDGKIPEAQPPLPAVQASSTTVQVA